jgi:hypothetical protein
MANRLSADVIGYWVDVEGSGDVTVQRALDWAECILRRLRDGPPRNFLLLTPRFGIPWEAENLHFLWFFAHGLARTSSQMVFVDTDAERGTLPDHWEVHWREKPEPPPGARASRSLLPLVPGIVEPKVADTLGRDASGADLQGLALAGGRMLIAPEERRPPSSVSRLTYDRLSVLASDFPWLKAFAQYHGNNIHVDSDYLAAEAARCIVEGGHGIGLRLIDRGIAACPHLVARASLQLQASGWRVQLQRYREASEMPDPSPALSEQMQGMLRLLKGWGLVMMGDHARAEPYLSKGRQQLESSLQDSREMLYVRNICALGRFRMGDVAGALEGERHIEEALRRQTARTGRTDWPLFYVNSINLARVKYRQGEWAESESYYRQAFATTQGLRSESDAVYSNVCWARLNESRGQLQEAFLGWFRAALHWVSLRVPEALGIRVVAAILGRRPPPGGNFCESISERLQATLLRAVQCLPGSSSLEDDKESVGGWSGVPSFVRSDQLPGEALQAPTTVALGGRGWSVLVLGSPAPFAFDGTQHRKLRIFLGNLLRWLGSGEAVERLETIALDDNLGCEIPQEPGELLETCVRLRVPRAIYEGSRFALPLDLRARLEEGASVYVGPAVDRIEVMSTGVQVTFKRYLSTKILLDTEASILAAIEDRPTLEVLCERLPWRPNVPAVLQTVRALEQDRLVRLRLRQNPWAAETAVD